MPPVESDIRSQDLRGADKDARLQFPGLINRALLKSSDLEALSTQRAEEFAARLAVSLDETKYDQLNQQLRSDYAVDPVPIRGIYQVKSCLDAFSPKYITREQSALVNCFLLGVAAERSAVADALGKDGADLISEGLVLGLFVERSEGKLSLNRLVLTSHKLIDGSICYHFTDTPVRLLAEGDRVPLPRVYLELDSYFLNAKLQSLSPLRGVVTEYGSGSGIQLITLLKLNPEIETAIGLEIDARARNVSNFNASLNGVKDRYAVTSLPEQLLSLLDSRPVRLAVSNPPFIPAPSSVEVPGEQVPLDFRAVFPVEGWGGEDGLHHTSSFLRMMSPLIDREEGEIIVLSQFLVREDNSFLAQTAASDAGFAHARIDAFPCGPSNLKLNLTPREWAEYLSGVTRKDMPLISSTALAAVEREAIAMFERVGAIQIQSGLLIASHHEVRADLAAEKALIRLESEMNLATYGFQREVPPLVETIQRWMDSDKRFLGTQFRL